MATEEDNSYTKLPIEKRCVHKAWKVRKSGYEEAIKLFVQLDDKDIEWNKFTETVKKFVIDSNVAAQEKGLEATLVFMENSATAGRVAVDVMNGLILKCYGSPKAKIKEIAVEVTLMLIEIEKQEVVIEELVKGMDHKFPKIVSVCIKVATQALKEFGSKVLNTKLLLKKLQSILENKDKNIREEAKLLAVEIYSWIGLIPIKTHLANLKPVQIQELEAEYEKVVGNKPLPTRFVRSEQKKGVKSEELMTANGDVVLKESSYEVADHEEHIDPINILSQISKDFYEKLEAKLWQERKEAIEMLESILLKAPKLECGDYRELIRALIKIITKDKNVVIVSVAVKCVTLLAKRLKKKIETYASDCIPALLEKFKEKKPSVVLPLRDAVDTIYSCMTLEAIQEDILIALNNKNPSIRVESVAFLARCFTKSTPNILNKKMLKIFTTVLTKTLNDSDPIVRDNSAEALGIIWKVVSEKNILPFLTGVDPIKFLKIKEAAAKVITTSKSSNNIEGSVSILSRDEKKETLITNKISAKKIHSTSNNHIKTTINGKPKKLKDDGEASVKQINADYNKHQKEVSPKPICGDKSKISTECLKVECDTKNSDYKIDSQDIAPRIDITSQITDDLIKAFGNNDWKVRSNALTKLQNIVSEAKFITSELGEIREVLIDRISDPNARLSSNTINLIEIISVAMGLSFRNYIKDYLPGVLNALGDPKTFKCQSARQCMNTWGDVCGFREFFGGNILLAALGNTSVKLRSELWTWLAEKLPIIPPKIIPAEELKCLLPLLYKNLEDKNASIRNASERTVVGFMQHLGYASMYNACDKLKPMSVKLCREKLDKERPNLPTIVIEKAKIVKSGSLVKSKGSKISPKTIMNMNKVNMIPLTSVAIKNKKEVNYKSLFQHNNLKHQRDIDEHKLKSLKWNFTTPRQEFDDQLREQMLTAGISEELITNMFHTDFKFHLKAIIALSEDLNVSDDNNLGLINNLDLILKWISLRFFDTNPSVLIQGLKYLQSIFDILMVHKYVLHDTEASSFVPYLVQKLGDSKDTVKNYVRTILKQIAFIFPTKKLFQYIMDGIKAKNSRQRSECLEHLTSMIKDYGTSICQPSVAAAFKEIVKSIGDRDKSVRTSALNCFVAAFFIHGDALFTFIGNISEKDMDLLKERLKRASKCQVVPTANFQPTAKLVTPPILLVPEVEEIVNDEYNSDSDENNVVLGVSLELNHESSAHICSSISPPDSLNNISHKTKVFVEQSYVLDTGYGSEAINKSRMTRFALDEKFMQDLEREVITIPKLILTPYHWSPDDDVDTHFESIIQEQSRNTIFTKYTETPSTSFESIRRLLNQISSENIETSNSAIKNLNKLLMRPNIRSMLLENDKILLIFYAIVRQFEILSESYDNLIFRHKEIFSLCFNVCNYQEFMLKLNYEIFNDLLLKLIHFLSTKEPGKSLGTKRFDQYVNNLIMIILERSDHTLVTCSLFSILYDMFKHPQNSSAFDKELLMKCIWKIVKDFKKWDDEICYDLVLAQIHRFLEKFSSKQRENQSIVFPIRTCKTALHTMVKIHRDKVLKSLAYSEFPKDSVMVVYIQRLIMYFNRV